MEKYAFIQAILRLSSRESGKLVPRKYFGSVDPDNKMHIHPNSETSFKLIYKDLVIGILSFKNQEWCFKYSSMFKDQNAIRSIIDFPDKSKDYRSNELWPFFVSRTPGMGQPIVKDFLHKNNLNETDIVALLKEFGGKCITNPYELVSA